jgi:outer membrane lipoprotein-sorting protein
MELFVNADDYSVRRVRYTDINDNIITIDFSKLQLGVEIAPERFRFKTPEGVEEVRLP